MAIQITPNDNILASGRLTVYEEQLLNKQLNADPKTVAKASRKQCKQKEEKGGNV